MLWGDSEKGAPAKDLQAAQAEVLRHVTSKPKRVGPTDAEVLEEHLDQCGSPIEIGHAGDHLGIPDAMSAPHPTADDVRAHFNAMTEDEQRAAIDGLVECPW